MLKKKKIKEAKTQLNEALKPSKRIQIKDNQQEHLQEEALMNQEFHHQVDHYHGIHHFDRYGNHDDVQSADFSLKKQFSHSRKSEIFRISIAAIILALSVGLSALDGLLEKFQVNIGGVIIEMRVLDILVIILAIPLTGLWYSMLIAVVEPWFHFLIDGDHSPIQIGFDSVGYLIAVLMFFFIFYGLFHNSPFHENPNKHQRRLKAWLPGLIIVPSLAIIFTLIFVLSLYLTFESGYQTTNWKDFKKDGIGIFFAAFGIQAARFFVFYLLFALVQKKLKPINHRYR